MSANEKMVMVPRDTVENAAELLQEYNKCGIARDLRAILAKPAQQGQGEPVALPARKDPTQGWAVPGGVAKADGWNEYHDEVAKLGPLYTHADPAEVERLRRDLHAARVALQARASTFGALRARLAETQALLRQANGLINLSVERLPKKHQTIREHAKQFRSSIESALSASAEPSAPVEIDEQPEFVKTITAKLQRFLDCAEDGQGADIGREWFDVLTKLGLLRRIQRSPAWWEVTEQGDALLARAALERKP